MQLLLSGTVALSERRSHFPFLSLRLCSPHKLTAAALGWKCRGRGSCTLPALFTSLYAGSALVIFGQQIGNKALLHLAETQATYLQDNPLTTRLLGAWGWKCSPSSSASVWKLQKIKRNMAPEITDLVRG